MDELAQGFRYWQRLAGFGGDAGPLQHLDDLQCVERVPARGLVHFGE